MSYEKVPRGTGFEKSKQLLPKISMKGNSKFKIGMDKLVDRCNIVKEYKSGSETGLWVQDLESLNIVKGVYFTNIKNEDFGYDDVFSQKSHNVILFYCKTILEEELISWDILNKSELTIRTINKVANFDTKSLEWKNISTEMSSLRTKGNLTENTINYLGVIQYGFKEDGTKYNLEDFYCTVTKEKLYPENVHGNLVNLSDKHHYCVGGSASIHKTKDENGKPISPSTLLNYNEITEDIIIELFGCMNLVKTTHSFVHGQGNQLDFRMFAKADLPYAIRNEENFNRISEYFGILDKMDNYYSFLGKHYNSKMHNKLIHEDWK